jgi:hypothetical protein
LLPCAKDGVATASESTTAADAANTAPRLKFLVILILCFDSNQGKSEHFQFRKFSPVKSENSGTYALLASQLPENTDGFQRPPRKAYKRYLEVNFSNGLLG